MKTLTIRLPDSMAKHIEEESLARGISKSDLVRERLDQPRLPSVREDGVLEILKASWSAGVPDGPPRFRSLKKQRLAEVIRAKKLHR